MLNRARKPIQDTDAIQNLANNALKADLIELFRNEPNMLGIHLTQGEEDPTFDPSEEQLKNTFNPTLSLKVIQIKLRAMCIKHRLVDNEGADLGIPIIQELGRHLFGRLQYYRIATSADAPDELTEAFDALPPKEKEALQKHLGTLPDVAAVDAFFSQPIADLKTALANLLEVPGRTATTNKLAEALVNYYSADLGARPTTSIITPFEKEMLDALSDCSPAELQIIRAAAARAKDAHPFAAGSFEASLAGIANLEQIIRDNQPDTLQKSAIENIFNQVKREQQEQLLQAIKNDLATCTKKQLESISDLASLQDIGYREGEFEKDLKDLKEGIDGMRATLANFEGVALSAEDIKNLDWDINFQLALNICDKHQLAIIRKAAEKEYTEGEFEETLLEDRDLEDKFEACNLYNEQHSDTTNPALLENKIKELIPHIQQAQRALLEKTILQNLEDLDFDNFTVLLNAADAALASAPFKPNEFEDKVAENDLENIFDASDSGVDLFNEDSSSDSDDDVDDVEGEPLTRPMVANIRTAVKISQNIRALEETTNNTLEKLTTIIDAKNPTAIRKALLAPQCQALIHAINVDLAAHPKDQTVLTNKAAKAIAKVAKAQRKVLMQDLPQTRQNTLTIQYKLTAMDQDNATLNAIANIRFANPAHPTAEDHNQIRAAILANEAALGIIGLNEHAIRNNTVLTDEDAISLHKTAINTRSKQRRERLETTIAAINNANKAVLLPVKNGVDEARIRAALNNNPNFGNLPILDANDLTDEDARAIRHASTNRYTALNDRPAPNQLPMPAEGTNEHTNLIRHIEQNLDTYSARITRLLGTNQTKGVWWDYRHNDSTKPEDLDNLQASCVAMRDQLATYQTYLNNRQRPFALPPENLPHISHKVNASINQLDTLLEKIDRKYSEKIKKIASFSDEAVVVAMAEADYIVDNFMHGANGMENGGLMGNELATEKFAQPGSTLVRVNHIALPGIKKGGVAHMVSIQKRENNIYQTEFTLPDNLNLKRRKWYATIPNDDLMKWAVAEINNYTHANSNPKKGIRIVGPMPEECAFALMLYCKYKNIQYVNVTGHIIDITKDHQDELEKRFEKRKDYITGNKPWLANRDTERNKQAYITEIKPRSIIKSGGDGT